MPGFRIPGFFLRDRPVAALLPFKRVLSNPSPKAGAEAMKKGEVRPAVAVLPSGSKRGREEETENEGLASLLGYSESEGSEDDGGGGPGTSGDGRGTVDSGQGQRGKQPAVRLPNPDELLSAPAERSSDLIVKEDQDAVDESDGEERGSGVEE